MPWWIHRQLRCAGPSAASSGWAILPGMSTEAPGPSAPPTDAPAEIAQFLKAWAPPVVTLVGAIAVALTSWQLLTQRVEALEGRVTSIATARDRDRELLEQMNVRLKLLVCRLDPPNCPRE